MNQSLLGALYTWMVQMNCLFDDELWYLVPPCLFPSLRKIAMVGKVQLLELKLSKDEQS